MNQRPTTDGSYHKRYSALVDDFLRFATDTEAQAWLEGEFGQRAEQLSPELRDALITYKNSDYERLNEHARNGLETREHLLVDDAIASHTLSKPVIGYRGIIDGTECLHRLSRGARIEDAGYWSLSLLEDIGWGFASTGRRPETRIVFRVRLDARHHAIPAAAPDLLEEMHEYELLLARGSQFELLEQPRLRRAAKAGGAAYYLIDVELMP